MNSQFFAEIVTSTVVTVQTIIATFLLATLPHETAEVMAWTLIPMIGATLAAGGAFCFNSQPEVRRIVIGRCLFAIVIGVLGPRILSMLHPWLKVAMIDPLILVGAGFVNGFVGYLMSWPFVRKAYERAPAVADRQMQAIENEIDRRIKQNNPTTKLEP